MTHPLLEPKPMTPEAIADLVRRTRRNSVLAHDARERERLAAIRGIQSWTHGPQRDEESIGRQAARFVELSGVSMSYAARFFGVSTSRVSAILAEKRR